MVGVGLCCNNVVDLVGEDGERGDAGARGFTASLWYCAPSPESLRGLGITALKGRYTSAMWCNPSLRGFVNTQKKAGRNDLPFDLTNQNPSWDSF